ncbi:MAG: hypothetical protein HY814_00090 [Candidatus Riflebacteria bacterium]|nr:hypothetical protein [Candidatus Riflebacteria bacterium]
MNNQLAMLLTLLTSVAGCASGLPGTGGLPAGSPAAASGSAAAETDEPGASEWVQTGLGITSVAAGAAAPIAAAAGASPAGVFAPLAVSAGASAAQAGMAGDVGGAVNRGSAAIGSIVRASSPKAAPMPDFEP